MRLAARLFVVAALVLATVVPGWIGLTASVSAADPAGIEFEIESTFTVTKFGGTPVVDGRTSAVGRIRLEPGPSAGTWRGRGELKSTTSSRVGGCGSLYIEGSGTYDWVVREAVVAPGMEADRIVVHMDAGPIVESLDKANLDLCSAISEGTANTWENLFFIVHNADYRAKGLEVRGWSLEATGTSWADGQLIASASWAGPCSQAFLFDCNEETVFRLYAVGGTSGPVEAPASPTLSPTPTPTPIDTAGGGGLAVATVDRAGDVLTKGCLELWTAKADGSRGTLVAASERCDQPLDPTYQIGPADGWVDGTLAWTGLAPGDYLVVETQAPDDGVIGYGIAPDAPVTISAGEVSRLTLRHDALFALTILKVDAAGAPLAGACFRIERQESGTRTRPVGSTACDAETSPFPGVPADGRPDGILVLSANDTTGKPGTYTLTEPKAPDGYAPIELTTVEIAPNQATVLTITNDTGPIAIAVSAPGAPTQPPGPTEPTISPPVAGLTCDDVLECASTYWPFVLGGLAALTLAAALGIQVLRRPTLTIEKLPPVDLNATGGLDPAMGELNLADGGLEIDKMAPTDPLLDKMAPTEPILEKIAPTDPLLDKIAPTDPLLDKIAPGDASLDKFKPTDPRV